MYWSKQAIRLGAWVYIDQQGVSHWIEGDFLVDTNRNTFCTWTACGSQDVARTHDDHRRLIDNGAILPREVAMPTCQQCNFLHRKSVDQNSWLPDSPLKGRSSLYRKTPPEKRR